MLVDGTKWDDYPCYHKPCDTSDKVNVAYLRAMTQLVASVSGCLLSPSRDRPRASPVAHQPPRRERPSCSYSPECVERAFSNFGLRGF